MQKPLSAIAIGKSMANHCHLSEITELKYTRSIKIIILEENFKWHLEAFVSELFIWKKEEISNGKM